MINADPQELAKFSELAHRWWDPDSEFRPLHQINPLRLEWIDGLAPLAGRRVLDVGCGGGILADSMARRGADVLGIDLAARALKVAQLHAVEADTPSIDYREVSAEALAAEQPGGFDVVTCMEMLEHVPDPSAIVSACATLVTPGGWVFFSTLNRNPKAFLFAIVGAEHVLNLLPKGTHEYARFIKPSELARWCRDAGLERAGIARTGLQPADAALPPDRRHQRELPDGLPARGMRPADARSVAALRPAAVLFDLDGTLVDSAPDLAGTANDMRAERGLAALPYALLRRMVGTGARGMVGTAFGVGPGDAGFDALRDEFLDPLRGALDARHARLRRHAAGARRARCASGCHGAS